MAALSLFSLLILSLNLTLFIGLNSNDINTAVNLANVKFETTVNFKNEAMIRTLHPLLRDFAIVYAMEPDNGQEAMWAVHLERNAQLYDIHVAGREVHIIPIYKLPEPNPTRLLYDDPLAEPLEGRRMLNDDEKRCRKEE